jgi:catechol 2,3-dioxygenase-like lactoylglutathione lyase family enzyme
MKMRCISALALAVLCACSLRLYAQAPAISGIAHVAYRVSSLEAEVSFLHKLGFEESFGFTRDGKTTEVFVKINDRQFFEVYPQTDPSQPLGWMHICYESDAINDLDALYVAHGLKASPVVKAGAGNLIFSLKDPEDRVTEFTQYMPGSRHSLDKGMHLGANRVSQEIDGIELPVPDLSAARQFYTAGLGFQARQIKSGLRVRITSQAYPWIDLSAAAAGNKPLLLFRVPDAAAAARQLRGQGLAVKQGKKLVSVIDPDGNVLAFIEDNTRKSTRSGY